MIRTSLKDMKELGKSVIDELITDYICKHLHVVNLPILRKIVFLRALFAQSL
jgi:hypothetical protein